MKRAAELHGQVNGVANCVGSLLLKPAHLTSEEEWDATVITNLKSAFAVLRAAAMTMAQEGGSIVLLSSAAARVGLANHRQFPQPRQGSKAWRLPPPPLTLPREFESTVWPGYDPHTTDDQVPAERGDSQGISGNPCIGSDRRAKRSCFRHRVVTRSRASMGYRPSHWCRRRTFPDSASTLMRFMIPAAINEKQFSTKMIASIGYR